AVHFEAAIISECGIEQAERMGKAQLMSETDLVAGPNPKASRAPFADAVEREDGGFIERTGEEGTGGVAFVMIEEDQRRSAPWDSLAKDLPQEQFLFQPNRHGSDKADETARRESQVGLQEALEFDERLFVEGDEVELLGAQAGFLEAIRNCGVGKSGVVFPPAETLLLDGGHNLSIHHQSSCAIVIERGNSQDCGHNVSSASWKKPGRELYCGSRKPPSLLQEWASKQKWEGCGKPASVI